MSNLEKFLGDLKPFNNPHTQIQNIPTPSPRNKEEKIQALHNLMLVSNTARRFIVQDQFRFGIYYNTQSENLKLQIEVLRPFWLGYNNPIKQPDFSSISEIEQFLSQKLIEDLSDLAACYRLNFDRTPAPLKRRNERSLKGHKPRLFRDWFKRHFEQSRFTYKLVCALAEGKSTDFIRKELGIPEEATLWGFKGPVLKKEELEAIQSNLLNPNYHPPTLEKIEGHNPQQHYLKELSVLQSEIEKLKKQNNELASTKQKPPGGQNTNGRNM